MSRFCLVLLLFPCTFVLLLSLRFHPESDAALQEKSGQSVATKEAAAINHDQQVRPVDHGQQVRPIDYGRQVRPILAEYCFACHGPSKEGRKARLRLDQAAATLANASSGRRIIEPGNSADSEAIVRMTSTHGDHMPPAGARQPSNKQIAILKQWIDEGAAHTEHWAYQPIRTPAVPQTKNAAWVRNPIDAFILAKLEQEGRTPSAEASRVTLARRLSLALIGLPPTPTEIDSFVNDAAPDAFDSLVGRLLASRHYGERMASPWLDLARYADTNGGNVDDGREMWAYRDWVIAAFNDNMPFDQFTLEQLAGDLLPTATAAQRIATGFLRNEPTQQELCGEQADTFRLIDRINTIGTVWLGSTLGCAQCHDHKYDPFSQRDYFRMLAFFNNYPRNPAPERVLGNISPLLKLPTPLQVARTQALQKRHERIKDAIAGLIAETKPVAEEVLAWERNPPKSPELPQGIQNILNTAPGKRTIAQIQALNAYYVENVHAPTRARFALWHEERTQLELQLKEIEANTLNVMVMEEPTDPQDTFLLKRGDHFQKGEKVSRGLPEFLPPLPKGAKADRLAFARWLTARENPLTARVIVNRIWQMHFGVGLVSTSDDFGVQGEPPTHPELLDWLSVHFIESGWDLQKLHKLIVSSATYRQSSRQTPQLREIDPANRSYARGPRFRLPAELIRDNCLAIGGLLEARVSGPGVRPYQPKGLWDDVRHPGTLSAQEYIQSHGSELYRRGVYLFWKRTMLHPSMTLFDAPNRDVCVSRRPITNTALQALALLNDPTVIESARGLATRMFKQGGNIENQLNHGFRFATARLPSAAELAALRRLYDAENTRFQAKPDAVTALLSAGESSVGQDVMSPHLAALTVVANLLLNLDETITLE